MNSWPSVSVTATADGRTDAAADAEAAAASEGDAALDGAAAEAAADGDEELPPVHAARKAARPANPVPARKPRRFTFAAAIRPSNASSSRSFSVIPFLLLPARRVDSEPQPTRTRFAASCQRTVTGSPGPSPWLVLSPNWFWRRTTSSPAWSVWT